MNVERVFLIFLIYMFKNSIRNKNLLACFSFGNKLETWIKNRKEIRIQILNKEGNDIYFESDWEIWIELKLASGWSILFPATKSDKTKTGKNIMKFHFLHFREFACVTEIIVKETLTIYVSVPFKIFSQQEINQSHNSLSSCCCTLFVIVIVYR